MNRRSLAILTVSLALVGCRKGDAPVTEAPARPAPKAGVSLDQAPETTPPPPGPEAPAPEPAAVASPAPNGAAALGAEARKKRNLAWLKILKTGSPQEKQKVQDQLTLLDSDQLHEIDVLYQQQEKK